MRVLSLLAVLTSSSVVAAPDHGDPWTHDDGVNLAKAAISKCLDKDARTPPDGSERCIRSAYLACESQHGTMSQHDINDCSYFSEEAWKARLVAIRLRLMAAKAHPLMRESPEPMKRMLNESDSRWNDWNVADCEIQSRFTEGGSMHPLEMNLCLSDHAAHRTLELERWAFWWDHAYDLPAEKPIGEYKAPRRLP